MSASKTELSAMRPVYATKADWKKAQLGDPTAHLAKQARGHAGWCTGDDGRPEQYIFVKTSNATKEDWVPVTVHQQNVAHERKRNYEFFRLHPMELLRKIREKKRGPSMFSHI